MRNYIIYISLVTKDVELISDEKLHNLYLTSDKGCRISDENLHNLYLTGDKGCRISDDNLHDLYHTGDKH
jgi:hypothetical protein